MMEEPEVTVVTPERFGTGESPTWDAENGRLLWTSIGDGDIHALTLATGAREKWHFDSSVGAFGLCGDRRLVVGLRDSVVLFDPVTDSRDVLAEIPQPIAEARLNDGKVGPDGAFWIGGMDERSQKEPIAGLYRVTGDGSVTELTGGLKTSNGLAWSPDGRLMYHSDSRGPWVDRWDFDPETGTASNRQRFATLDEATGRPDGGAMDIEGCYWSAGPSASVVNRFAPDGTLLARFHMPTFRPTMPCFGGPDMKTVFVTSLSGGVSAAQLAEHPLSGKTVSFRAEVAGTLVDRFDA